VVQLTRAELVARILQSASDSALSDTSSTLTGRVSWNIIVCSVTAAWISYADHIVRVLIVEDDVTIARFVARGLAEEGFTVDTAHDGRTAFTIATAEHFDLAIVDLMLPEIDGLSLIEQLRAHGITMPVLILTAKRSLDERVEGLQRGGDDYLTKPFAFPELLARVQALLRRAGGRPESARLVVGDLSLDRLRRVVERQGRPIELRAREFAVLELLMRHAGQVVSKTMILSQVWGYNFDPGSNVVDVAVFRLREKVDKGFDTPMIFTVRGAGYVLKAA
jgi:two-component system OmpR family response regulator